ncbi:MAG: type III pantothenate kinase, partial [Exilispira sp.]
NLVNTNNAENINNIVNINNAENIDNIANINNAENINNLVNANSAESTSNLINNKFSKKDHKEYDNLPDYFSYKIKIERIKYIENSKLSFNYNPVSSYGDDRLALLYYIVDRYPKDSVIGIDSGTAITIDTLYNSNFEGGIICPGINLSLKSLFYKTRQLPLISKFQYSNIENIYRNKKDGFGFSTEQCILYGLYNLVTGLILNSINIFCEKIKKNYNLDYIKPIVLLTGGDSKIIYNLIEDKIDKSFKIVVEENAVLLGLNYYNKILYLKN